MDPLRYAAKFDPFLSLDCARVEGVGAQILPSGNLERGREGERRGGQEGREEPSSPRGKSAIEECKGPFLTPPIPFFKFRSRYVRQC